MKSRRDFLKLAAASSGATLGAGLLKADEFVADKNVLPPGSVGDPQNVWFGKHIFPLDHTMEDGPSAALVGGKVLQPAQGEDCYVQEDIHRARRPSAQWNDLTNFVYTPVFENQ